MCMTACVMLVLETWVMMDELCVPEVNGMLKSKFQSLSLSVLTDLFKTSDWQE